MAVVLFRPSITIDWSLSVLRLRTSLDRSVRSPTPAGVGLLYVCRACSTARRCKSSTQVQHGECLRGHRLLHDLRDIGDQGARRSTKGRQGRGSARQETEASAAHRRPDDEFQRGIFCLLLTPWKRAPRGEGIPRDGKGLPSRIVDGERGRETAGAALRAPPAPGSPRTPARSPGAVSSAAPSRRSCGWRRSGRQSVPRCRAARPRG